MAMRLLMLLDLADKERVTRALGNIKNFLTEVPAGIVELVRLQEEGIAYVKP